MSDGGETTDAVEIGGLPGIKHAEALRTIGEVAATLGVRHHVLRYWEEQFPMLRPVKRSGGRRYYRPEDVALLRTIHRLLDREGYTLRGARAAIEGGAGVVANGPERVPTSAALTGGTDAIDRLRHVRRILAEALDAS